MAIAITLFAISLFGIVALFAVKAWEEKSARTLAPSIREKADQGAESVKHMIARSQEEARKLPPEMLYLARTILHDAALGAAALARFLERQSHRLADYVSHKRGFERKQSTNEFLNNVSEYRNGSESVPESDTSK